MNDILILIGFFLYARISQNSYRMLSYYPKYQLWKYFHHMKKILK